MRYSQHLLQDRSKAVFLKKRLDKRSMQVYISADEHRKLRGDEPAKRIDFVFIRTACLEMDFDYGQFLLDKYPEVVFAVDGKTGAEAQLSDDLDELKYNELMRLLGAYNSAAEEMGFERVSMKGKMPEVKQKIRNLRSMGVNLEEETEENEGKEDEEVKHGL